jgi:hypothetical protein
MKKDYIFFILFFILVLCFLFILISFYLFKYLQIKVLDKWYLNDYSRNNKKLLSEFGDWDIKYIYLVKEPISKFSYILMNIISLNSFSNAIYKYNDDNTPNHIFLILELTKGKDRKTCILEKNTCLNIGFNYMVTDKQNKLKMKPSKKISLFELLEITKKRVGSKEFFNFEIYENNCQKLAIEILITIDKYNKKTKKFLYKEVLYCTEFIDEIFCFDFNKYLVNSCFNIYNMIRAFMNRLLNH